MKCVHKVLIYNPCKHQHSIMISHCCSRSWMLWEVCSKRMWTLIHKDEWSAGVFSLTTLHVKTFKLARVLRTASMCCHDGIHEARLGVNEVDTGEEGMEARRRVDKTTCAENASYRNLWSPINKNAICVCARHGRAHSMCFITTPKFVDSHRRAPTSICELNFTKTFNR